MGYFIFFGDFWSCGLRRPAQVKEHDVLDAKLRQDIALLQNALAANRSQSPGRSAAARTPNRARTPGGRRTISCLRNKIHPKKPTQNIKVHLNKVGPVLRDTARLSQRYPPIARHGLFGVSTWPIGCDTPSPFSEPFLLSRVESMRSGGQYPPLKRGISAILARYPMKTMQMGAIPPLR